MGHSRKNRGMARREQLRAEGDERQELRASRSNAQQLELLNQRLGEGVGAKRERARLTQEIDASIREKSKKKSESKSSGRDKKSTKAKHRRERESSKVRRETKG